MREDECAGGGLGYKWRGDSVGTAGGHLEWSVTVAVTSPGMLA